MSNDLATQVGFGTEIPTSNQYSKAFKPEEGKTVRVAIAWLDEKNVPQLIHEKVHYVAGAGNIRHQPGFEKITKKQPTTRVGTVLFVFRTDDDGELLRDENDKPVLSGWEVMPWLMSSLKYQELAKLHKNWNLAKHDLLIECTDAKYMKLVVQPAQESIFQKMLTSKQWGEKIKTQIAEKVQQVKNMIARDFTEEELRESLGLGSTQTVDLEDLPVETLDEVFGE